MVAEYDYGRISHPLAHKNYLIVVQNQIDISKDPSIVKIVAGSNQENLAIKWPFIVQLEPKSKA